MKHASEECFGFQMATKTIAEGLAAAKMAADAGASWIDINCGCPIIGAASLRLVTTMVVAEGCTKVVATE